MKTKMSHVIITLIIAIAICFAFVDRNVLTVSAFFPEATETPTVTANAMYAHHNAAHQDLNFVGNMHAIDVDEKIIPIKGDVASQETKHVEKLVTSSPDITLSYEYVQSDVMPYVLYTPSTAETNEKTPLIISLHGMGDRGTSAENFTNKFISKMLMNWELEGFNSYVMIPHLTGNAYDTNWNNPATAERFFAVVDQLIEEYNIDTDRIIIQGQSMGGYGCLYMAAYRPEYFSAVVPISSYDSNANLSKLSGMPIRCYVGSASHGESGTSVNFVTGTLAQVFGEETIFQRECSHDEIPIVAFTEDSNEDGQSDLIEWMLSQNKSDRNAQEI
jgi:predicted peptidase